MINLFRALISIIGVIGLFWEWFDKLVVLFPSGGSRIRSAANFLPPSGGPTAELDSRTLPIGRDENGCIHDPHWTCPIKIFYKNMNFLIFL